MARRGVTDDPNTPHGGVVNRSRLQLQLVAAGGVGRTSIEPPTPQADRPLSGGPLIAWLNIPPWSKRPERVPD